MTNLNWQSEKSLAKQRKLETDAMRKTLISKVRNLTDAGVQKIFNIVSSLEAVAASKRSK